QEKKLEAEYNVLFRKIRNRRDPRLVQMKDDLDAINEVLRDLGRQRMVDARDNYYASAQRERYLQNEFTKLKKEELETSRHKVQHDLLTQQVESAKEAQKALQKRLDEIVVNVKSDQETVFLIDRAFPATHHISPNEVANLWNGCLLGLFFGLILAVLLDFLDNTVRSVEDLQDNLQIPVLGVVPEFSKALLEKTDPLAEAGIATSVESIQETSAVLEELGYKATQRAKVSTDTPVPLHYAPYSKESEAFRSVLVALTSAEEPDSTHKILITSGQKGDGKTTLAINLAIALAQMGEKTLLIDGDLRVPSLHEYFKSTRDQAGLVDCLEDGQALEEVVVDVGIENLNVLLSGRMSENPVRLLRSNKLAAFMDAMSAYFNYIIVDSAPIAPVSDALLLSRYVDGVAVVVRSGETPQLVAESAVTRLRQVGANILGLVLNDASTSHLHWKLKSGYGNYSDYGYSSYDSRE
ncbi:MAG: polysaccharide biosynthesis tyrosine autokinase, partial [Bdellovibrionales bacterium]|nr:polysaccharide biosynthesis tyrosine autokinase [Bdellovibrionales bacterium]